MSFRSIFEKYDVYKECPNCKNKALIELEEGLFVCDNCGQEFNDYKEELNEDVAYTFLTVEPNYTGGGIYLFAGRLSDGTWFEADSSFFDVRIFNADPIVAGDDAWYADWQEEHFVKDLDEKAAKDFFKQMLTWVLENKPAGNYSDGELEQLLLELEDESLKEDFTLTDDEAKLVRKELEKGMGHTWTDKDTEKNVRHLLNRMYSSNPEYFDESLKEEYDTSIEVREEDGLIVIYQDGEVRDRFPSIEAAEEAGWIISPVEDSILFDFENNTFVPRETVEAGDFKFIYDDIPNQNDKYITYFWDIYKNNGNRTNKSNRLSIYVKDNISYPYHEDSNDKTVVSFAYNSEPPFKQVPIKDYLKNPKQYDSEVLNELKHLVESLKEDTIKQNGKWLDTACNEICKIVDIKEVVKGKRNSLDSFKDVDIVVQYNDSPRKFTYSIGEFRVRFIPVDESLTEDTIKTKDGKWVNKGKEGTHGKFKTKKAADAQRKAMFSNGYKEELKEEYKTLAKLSNGLSVISYPYGYAVSDGYVSDRLVVRGDSFVVDDGRFKLSDKDKTKINNLIKKGILKESLKESKEFCVEPHKIDTDLYDIVFVKGHSHAGKRAHTKRFESEKDAMDFIKRNWKYNNWFLGESSDNLHLVDNRKNSIIRGDADPGFDEYDTDEDFSLDLTYPNITLDETPDPELLDGVPDEFLDYYISDEYKQRMTDDEWDAIDYFDYIPHVKDDEVILDGPDETLKFNSFDDYIKFLDYNIIQMHLDMNESLKDEKETDYKQYPGKVIYTSNVFIAQLPKDMQDEIRNELRETNQFSEEEINLAMDDRLTYLDEVIDIQKYLDRLNGTISESINEAVSLNTFTNVEPIYTGGGVYLFLGALSDGTWFIADNYLYYAVRLLNADPMDTKEALKLAWQKDHLIKNLDEEESTEFFTEMLNWVIKNKPAGNYLMEDIEELLYNLNEDIDSLYEDYADSQWIVDLYSNGNKIESITFNTVVEAEKYTRSKLDFCNKETRKGNHTCIVFYPEQYEQGEKPFFKLYDPKKSETTYYNINSIPAAYFAESKKLKQEFAAAIAGKASYKLSKNTRDRLKPGDILVDSYADRITGTVYNIFVSNTANGGKSVTFKTADGRTIYGMPMSELYGLTVYTDNTVSESLAKDSTIQETLQGVTEWRQKVDDRISKIKVAIENAMTQPNYRVDAYNMAVNYRNIFTNLVNKLDREYGGTTNESLNEKLVDVPEEDIAEFEAILAKHNFSIDDKGQTLMGRIHYQIRDNSGAHIDFNDRKALRDFLDPLIDDIHKFEKEKDIPITWNFGLDKNGIITGGLDLDKKWVEDEKNESLSERYPSDQVILPASLRKKIK